MFIHKHYSFEWFINDSAEFPSIDKRTEAGVPNKMYALEHIKKPGHPSQKVSDIRTKGFRHREMMS